MDKYERLVNYIKQCEEVTRTSANIAPHPKQYVLAVYESLNIAIKTINEDD